MYAELRCYTFISWKYRVARSEVYTVAYGCRCCDVFYFVRHTASSSELSADKRRVNIYIVLLARRDGVVVFGIQSIRLYLIYHALSTMSCECIF